MMTCPVIGVRPSWTLNKRSQYGTILCHGIDMCQFYTTMVFLAEFRLKSGLKALQR